jgi:hypothetical protein
VSITVIEPCLPVNATFTPLGEVLGLDPHTQAFTDTSTATPTAWTWNATNVTGNNTPFTFSTINNPSHDFGVGNFFIQLNVSNACSANTSWQITFINVSAYIPPAPTPTPNVTSTTQMAPPQYAEKTYFYWMGGISVVFFLGSILVKKAEDVLAGIATVLLFVTAVLSTTVNVTTSSVLFDPPVYFSNGTAMTPGTQIINSIHLIQAVPEITILFGILCGIAFVNTIRFYTMKVAEYTEET